MAGRVKVLASQLRAATAAPGSSASSAADDDVVIVAACRTPICKAKRGGFKDATADALLRTVLQEVLARGGVAPSDLDEICVGNVLAPGGAVMARMAQLEAGIPFTVPLSTVNRQCSSSLQAIANVFNGIKSGSIQAGIGAGVETMSSNSMADATPLVDWETVRATKDAWDCTIAMGITSENIAERYGVSREEQDAYAVRSHRRAAAALATGAFAAEIVPVTLTDGTVVNTDDGVRGDTTAAKLSKLQPAFKEGGTTTAGNSSQVSDGAAAVILMRRSVAAAKGLPVLGVMRSYAVVGVAPDEMGVGPAFAIPAALEKAGLTMDDISVFEINEAFASQLLYCVRKLGLEGDLLKDSDRVNPMGGAIALGHPLGCTGARQVATLLSYLRRSGKRYGVVSMCIGTGMGMAAVLENEAAAPMSR